MILRQKFAVTGIINDTAYDDGLKSTDAEKKKLLSISIVTNGMADNDIQGYHERAKVFDIPDTLIDVEVAAFTEAEVARLLRDERIIRNKGKIHALIRNAQTFLAIKQKYGSFQKYLDSIDKSQNYAKVIKTLVNNFKWLGPPSASTFLYTVGEDIDVWGH